MFLITSAKQNPASQGWPAHHVQPVADPLQPTTHRSAYHPVGTNEQQPSNPLMVVTLCSPANVTWGHHPPIDHSKGPPCWRLLMPHLLTQHGRIHLRHQSPNFFTSWMEYQHIIILSYFHKELHLEVSQHQSNPLISYQRAN